MKFWRILALAILTSPTATIAQETGESNGALAVREPAPAAFGIGERLTYRVKFGPLEVGVASLEVIGLDSIDGHPVYHVRQEIEGGTFFYKLHDINESWIDVYKLASRRFRQDLREGDWSGYWTWDFNLDSLTFSRSTGETGTIPEGAIDQASFLYFVRSGAHFEVGETREWTNYFIWENNPVIVHVLRRERVKVPAGEYETIVVRPIIKSGGMYGESGEAELYLTDDERRIPVILKTKMVVGSLTMELTEIIGGEKLSAEMLRAAR